MKWARQKAYLGQDVLASELPHDEAMLIRSLLMASIDNQTVVFGLDVDLIWLEVLNIYVDTEFFVRVHHLKFFFFFLLKNLISHMIKTEKGGEEKLKIGESTDLILNNNNGDLYSS